MLQLGQLHIHNSFHVIGDPPLGASPLPVCDQMDVKLENISLCRLGLFVHNLYCKDCNVYCECYSTQPWCCNVYCVSVTLHNLGAVMCTV